jgi:hypothetical protein
MVRSRKRLGTSCLMLASLALFATSAQPAAASQIDRFNQFYGELLARYWVPAVKINNIETTVFDYARMAEDRVKGNDLFDRIDAELDNIDATQLDGGEAKAFWINAYNYGAMRLVVESYPVDSIRSLKISWIKYPWSQKAVKINNVWYRLKQIERDILLARFKDPRIVFAVSCAAVSCPDRVPQPFTAQALDDQLDAMIKTFLSNPRKGMRWDPASRRLLLSWILDKDAVLFEGEGGGVLGFVSRYVSESISNQWKEGSLELEYLDHDWTLNDLAQVDR